MKRIYLYLLAGVLSLTGFAGCNDAESPVLENTIYLEEAKSRDAYDCLLKPMRDTKFNVTVRMTHKLDHDVTLTLSVDENLLKSHFEKFGEDLTVLPRENWVLYNGDGTASTTSSAQVTIPAGQVTAVLPVEVFNYEGSASQYALPITISTLSDDIHLLGNQRSVLYVFQAPFTTPVVFIDSKSSIRGRLEGLPTTTDWTVEFHYAIEAGVGDTLWGVPLFEVSSNNAECIYIRQYRPGGMDIHLLGTFGVGSYDLASIGKQDLYTNAANNGIWCHFALVCQGGVVTSYLNGQPMNTTSSTKFNTAYKFTTVTFCGGFQNGRVGFSEARIWSVARTQPQLTRFKYDVSPDSPGLLAYYKVNEGPTDASGNKTAKLVDLSPYHNDIDISTTENVTMSDGDHTFFMYKWGVAASDDSFTSLRTVTW